MFKLFFLYTLIGIIIAKYNGVQFLKTTIGEALAIIYGWYRIPMGYLKSKGYWK